MTEYLDQHPLLCDECTDEELHNIESTGPRFQRRFRNKLSSRRARTHALGAASIIARWPDHLSSLLTYWWIGFGMIAIMVFVIYNSIAAIAIFPQTYTKQFKNMSYNNIHENSPTLNIYMHVFISNDEEFNIDYFLPYVEDIVIKYRKFKYNFIAVKNDITQHINDLGDKQNNEMALNSLWTGSYNNIQRKEYNNFTVKVISLTKYLDASPMTKYWRHLPNEFISFMTRAISIWDKGGIAFNPLILTPKTPNSIYLEKLYNLLDNFQSEHIYNRRKEISKKPKVKLNNIRDIISNLKYDDMDGNVFSEDLSVAESIQTVAVSPVKGKVSGNLFSSEQYIRTTDKVDTKVKSETQPIPYLFQNKTNYNQTNSIAARKHKLKNFIDYILYTNTENSTLNHKFENSTGDIIKTDYNSTRDIIKTDNSVLKANINVNDILSKEIISEISPRRYMKTNNKSIKTASIEINSKQLIIDLKGHLIATETPCHAFIGTIFSNIVHYTEEESLTNFIISELTVFCKGSLSSCNGVEVILL